MVKCHEDFILSFCDTWMPHEVLLCESQRYISPTYSMPWLLMHRPYNAPGSRLSVKTVPPSMVIPILKIRRSQDRLIFNMRIHILLRRQLYVETASRSSTAWAHYGDVIMSAIASQITSLTIVYSTVYSDADQRKHRSSASLAFVRGIHRGPVNSSHKWPVTRKMFPFDDVIILGIDLVLPEYSGFSTLSSGCLCRYCVCGEWDC